MSDYGKDEKDLYCIIADMLDEDVRRTVDALDGVDMEILSYAIENTRENYDSLSLGPIMRECIDIAIDDIDFEGERIETLERLVSGSEAYEFVENFDTDDLKESITYEDGVTFTEYGGLDKEEMGMAIKFFPESMKQLSDLLGEIDNLPEVEIKEDIEMEEEER